KLDLRAQANFHGEHEPPRQVQAPRRAGPSRPPTNLRRKHTPPSGRPASGPPRRTRTSSASRSSAASWTSAASRDLRRQPTLREERQTSTASRDLRQQPTLREDRQQVATSAAS